MTDLLPLAQEEYFDEVSHQGKTIKVGDKVVVRQAGEEKVVEVTSMNQPCSVKREAHDQIL